MKWNDNTLVTREVCCLPIWCIETWANMSVFDRWHGSTILLKEILSILNGIYFCAQLACHHRFRQWLDAGLATGNCLNQPMTKISLWNSHWTRSQFWLSLVTDILRFWSINNLTNIQFHISKLASQVKVYQKCHFFVVVGVIICTH